MVRLTRRHSRRICCWSEKGKLDLIEEKPDPIFAALDMTISTLKCDNPECGKLTIV